MGSVDSNKRPKVTGVYSIRFKRVMWVWSFCKNEKKGIRVGAILVRAGLLIRRPALSLLYNSFDFILWPRNFLYFSRNSVVM